MKKYEITWWEQHKQVVEAENVDEAFENLNISEEGEYLGSDNYQIKEIEDEEDWVYEQVTGDASLAIAVANGSIKLTEEDNNVQD
jgi:hypothetical protein